MSGGDPVLDIRGLHTIAGGPARPAVLVNDVSLSVRAGETLAVVGESGSGKTMTFLSALGVAPVGTRVTAGRVLLQGRDLLRLTPEARRALRGSTISMVFQDPLTALNPVFTVGRQLMEVIRAHRRVSWREARMAAADVLRRVHIPDPARRIGDYPHQLSGGMRQRVLIGMAIALEPKVLVADEPTTALDATVQVQLLELLAELGRGSGMALVLITHDLGLVARYANRVAVMYAGQVVELGPAARVFRQPRHPYTVALFRSVPTLDGETPETLPAIEGQPPSPSDRPPGCAFEPRCFLGHGRSDCRAVRPTLSSGSPCGHESACLHAAILTNGAS